MRLSELGSLLALRCGRDGGGGFIGVGRGREGWGGVGE
jgi:hypothetical protein